MAFQLGSAPLKRFYKYLLKRVIGSFLKKDIDLDQLEVQLWSGQVQLKNLDLDVSVLNAMGLRCAGAHLGCVKMVVPWRRLVSDHCKVYISGLHLAFTKADGMKAPSPVDDTPRGIFTEAPKPPDESKYTEEGIETLSRLVKRVLGRMEVCLEDSSVSASLKPSLLRARLSEAVLFSEEGEGARSLRVGVLSLSMAPQANESEVAAGVDLPGEVVFLSTRGQDSAASAGVLSLSREGGLLSASLQLPAIRAAFTPASCRIFAESMSFLAQALRRQASPMPDIEDLENCTESPTQPAIEDPEPHMVQSLLFQSAMAQSAGHFWQDLYSLFKADDQLASATGEDEEAVEGEDAELDQQEEEAFLDVLEGEEPRAFQKISLKVAVDYLFAAICFQLDQDFWDAGSYPQPRLLRDAEPLLRPEDQAQLCMAGLAFHLEKEIASAQAPAWSIGAECLGIHLHRQCEEDLEQVSTLQPPLGGRSLVASDLFRSAWSHFEPPRTPSASSERCPTEESEGESESFGNSSVHSFGDPSPAASCVEDHAGVQPDEELRNAFFARSMQCQRAKVGPVSLKECGGAWRQTASFHSKQLLQLHRGTGSSPSPKWPASPTPGSEHPIWSSLGFHEGSPQSLRVRSTEVGLRCSCLPLQLNLCSTSVQFLLRVMAGAWSGEPAEWDGTVTRSGPPRPLPAFVVVAPAIRIVLRLPDSSSAVADLVLPRVLSRPLADLAEPYEALRADTASAVLHWANSEEVLELLSLRPGGGVVHSHGLEAVLLTRQAPPSPASASLPPEAPSESPLAGWTRLTALHPAHGHVQSPVPPEPIPEQRLSEDESFSDGESLCPMELELSLCELRLEASLSNTRVLLRQAEAFLEELTTRPEAREAPRAARLGVSAFVECFTARLCKDDKLEGRHVSAVQLSLMSCHLRNSSLMVEDLRLECIEHGTEGASLPHTLVRPWFRPSLCQRQTGEPVPGEVTLSSYLWEAGPRRDMSMPSTAVAALTLRGETLRLRLNRLVLILERPLLEQCQWLLAEPVDEPAEQKTTRTLRIQLSDCLLDVPSESFSRHWPSGPHGVPPPKERGADTEQWRIVVQLSHADGETQANATGVLRFGALTVHLSDHPAHLQQLELLSDDEDFLAQMGFVPFLEISSASLHKETPQEAELHVGPLQCQLRADSARVLRRVAQELGRLLPEVPAVQMPEATPKAMPSDFDLGEPFLAATRFDAEEDVLAAVDMFAFAPQPREPASDDLEDTMESTWNGGRHGTPLPPELLRASSGSSSSCRVDEYIRAQERWQSPRSPVTAWTHEPHEEGLEMELSELPEAFHEGPQEVGVPLEPGEEEAMAVCLFDPEVVSEQRLQELYDEEAVARQQVEQQFLPQTPAPAPSEQVRHQDGTSVVIFDPEPEITEDYFVRGELGNRKFEAPRWAPPSSLVLRLHFEEISLGVYQGVDFPSCRDKEAIASDRQNRSHVIVLLRSIVAKFMQFPAMSRPLGHRQPAESSLRYRMVLCVRDFLIEDRVHGSVFSRVLASFEDEEKRPRPSMADMLHCRVDELVRSSEPDAPEMAPEYDVELQLLPLQLTVDQDTVEFLENFWQLSSMSTYVEESDYLAAAGIPEEAPEAIPGPPEPPEPTVQLFFRQVTLGSLLVSVDYKAKRLDVEALRRGELWQLVNLLPLLEGLQVHFRSVPVKNATGFEKVLAQVVRAWSSDLNRTQLLRSLTGITPIRSIANISGGFAEMVLEPLKQYRAGKDADRVSRTMLRGLITFLRHITIESIDLTEQVFLGAQAALEYANTCLADDAPKARLEARDAGTGSDWLPVERGASHFMQPGGATEGLQEAGSKLSRGLRNAGPFLVRPLLEIQRGAPKKQVLRSVVSGIPMCFLRPAIGVTSAAVPAIRGVRNRLDPQHRREMVRKYRGPG